MENRSLSVAARLIVLLALPVAGAVLASEAAVDREADWQGRIDQAATMQAEGKSRQDAARARLEREYADCKEKFLVNACRQEAHKAYVAATREARRLENEGKALERAVRKEQLAEREQRQAAEAPQRAAELEAREAETAASRQAAEDKASAVRADKERRATEGEQRKAAEAEKRRQKQAAHDARVAEKMREAERRAADAAAGK